MKAKDLAERLLSAPENDVLLQFEDELVDVQNIRQIWITREKHKFVADYIVETAVKGDAAFILEWT